jgi:hypothetical protein
MPESDQRAESKSEEVPSNAEAEKNFKLKFTRVCNESLEGKSEETKPSDSSGSSE